MKILLADDEVAMLDAVTDILTYQQYDVVSARNGIEALELAQNEKFDGLVLDIMMPGMDGLSVLHALRNSGVQTPILLLTARGGISDRVTGLDAGADDYLAKPFAASELLARIRAMVRRPTLAAEQLTVGNITLNANSGQLSCGSRAETLSKKELELISLLIQNKGIYFSTETLMDRIWGFDSEAETGTVWVHISNLRKKLYTLEANVAIQCRRGIGYTLEVLNT